MSEKPPQHETTISTGADGTVQMRFADGVFAVPLAFIAHLDIDPASPQFASVTHRDFIVAAHETRMIASLNAFQAGYIGAHLDRMRRGE